MKNELLLIPEKADSERESVAKAWIKNGGEVIRIGKFWERPTSLSGRISIYGNDTFSLVLAQVIGVDLMQIQDDSISKLDINWIKRKIRIEELSNFQTLSFPIFIKPVKPKLFSSKVYQSKPEFLSATADLSSSEKIIVSEIIEIETEIRAFVLDKTILDAAVYSGSGDLNSANKFINDFIHNNHIELPKSYVVDIGFNSNVGWFIIEFNSSWGAGLNSCDPEKVIYGIREATIN